jgi:integrase
MRTAPNIQERDGVYHIDVTVGGQRIRLSAETSDFKKAQAFLERVKKDAYERIKLGNKPRRTFEEACVRWLQEKAHKKSLHSDKEKIRFFKDHFAGQYLDQIDRERVADLLAQHRGQATAGTKNRHVALIRGLLRRARDVWEWIDRVPAFQTYEEPKKRIAFATAEQFQVLLDNLKSPYREAAIVAVATGLRRANVFGLRWDHVDLDKGVAWVDAEDAKGGRSIPVPLNADAQVAIRAQRGKHDELVFAGKWRVLPDAWKRAVKAAGLPEGFRWHDLRHTFASWHAMAGTPMHILQELGGWSTPSMVQRYAHLSQSHLIEQAQRIAIGVKPALKVAA